MGRAWLVSSRTISNLDVMQRAKINGIIVMDGPTAMLELSSRFAEIFNREINAGWHPEQLLLPLITASKPRKSGNKPGSSKRTKVD